MPSRVHDLGDPCFECALGGIFLIYLSQTKQSDAKRCKAKRNSYHILCWLAFFIASGDSGW